MRSRRARPRSGPLRGAKPQRQEAPLRATCSTLLTRRSFTATVAAVAASLASGCARSDHPGHAEDSDEVTYLTNFGQLGRDAYSYHAPATGLLRRCPTRQ